MKMKMWLGLEGFRVYVLDWGFLVRNWGYLMWFEIELFGMNGI